MKASQPPIPFDQPCLVALHFLYPRLLVETVLSMLTMVCHFKHVMHRGWADFQARLAFTMAAVHVLVQWHGFQPSASGFVPLSMVELNL
jgi:hypothetical protein